MGNVKKDNILRISDGKDLIKDTELLVKYIKDHDTIVNAKYLDFYNAYNCNPEIFDKSKVKAKAEFKPDYRVAVNYSRYIVDTYNGFARGIPVKISSANTNVSDYVKFVSDYNELDDINAEVHKMKCIFGEAYQIVYVDEDGEISTVPVDPIEAFPIYDNSIKPKVRYFVRTYFDEDNKRHGTISDNQYVRYFNFDGSDIVFDEERLHGFDDVPAVIYTMNSSRIGLIEIVLSMCNAYDKAMSEKANDVDAFADAYMKVLGATLTKDQVDSIRDKRLINIGGKDGANVHVDFMQKPSGDATQEHLLERLERLIFTVSMVCNVSDTNFATSSGIALKMKMQPMSNLAAGDWRRDHASMKHFWRLVFKNALNNRVYENALETLQFNNYLNYPDDQADAAAVASALSGIVSHRTQLSVLPASIVPDVDAELEQIEKEKEEANKQALELAMQQAAISSQQTQQTEQAEDTEQTEQQTEETEQAETNE